MTHSEIDTGPRLLGGGYVPSAVVSVPHSGDAETLTADLVRACALAWDGPFLLLLFDPVSGGVRTTRVHHPDERRAVVVQARLTAELRALEGPAGLVLPVDADALPEPVRAVLAEELGDVAAGASLGSSVLVVPVTGTLGPVGVLVMAQSAARAGAVADGRAAGAVDHLIGLGRRFGQLLELARLDSDATRDAALMAALTEAVIAVDERDVVTQWNQAAEEVYRITASEAIGARLHDLVRTVFRGVDAHAVHTQVLSEGRWSGRVRQTSRSGPVVDCEVRLVSLTGPDGRHRGRLGIYRLIVPGPKRPVRQEPAREPGGAQRAQALDLVRALDSPAAVLDASGTVVSSNARWQLAVTDAPRTGCGAVPPGQSWTRALAASGAVEPRELAVDVERLLSTGAGVIHADCRCVASDREATVISVVPTEGGGAVVVLQPPRSGPKPPADELTFRATHDELTGLPNRAKLMDDLSSSLDRLDGTGKLAVLFCDLDGFKDINDGLGHAVGDQVLIAVAKRLRQRCRSADVVARFGGDEFVVVLSITEAAQAIAMADRIVEVLAEPIVVGEAEVAPGVSVGITVVDVPPDDHDPVGTLLRDADTAMYHAKGRGRGRYELFDASLRENIEERLELAAALHRAVADDQLEIVYQSRRHCGDRRVAGVEAMLRWRHPTLGLLNPDVFIPIAERTGRIVELGEWVLRNALEELAALGDPRITLAVNVSPRQLAGGRLARAVAQSLAATGVDPSRLTLEITESAFVDDPDVARSVLADLRGLGVSIALDDFGTGWSSLQYLRTLPVDVLKIDRSFVADLPTNLDACAVVAAVLQLGHGMGLVVVAEGVENDDHLSVLRDMGCDEYQGFIDGLPGSLADVLRSP